MQAVTVEYTTPEGNPPVAVLRIDDGKANALSPALLDALAAAIAEVDASDARALVVAGRAGFFSGGLDLKVLPKLPTVEKRAVLARLGDVLLALFTFRAPTVAAVSGHAIAGGALLALSADLRLGADVAGRFGVTEVAIGLPVPSFGLLLARAALSPPVVTEVALHARTLTLQEARDRGVLCGLFPADALLETAIGRAGELARLHGPAYAATKRALWADDLARVQGGLGAEVERFIDLFEARFPG